MRRMKPVSKKNVVINDGFISFYTRLVSETIIPYQWEALNDQIPGAAQSHAVRNFKIAAGLEKGKFNGFIFQDSDVAKWIEAVGYSLMIHPDSNLEKTADELIDLIGKAQQPDGYLNTYYIINKEEKRWSNLFECHELYCAGHMIEAAVAYYEATGKRKLLNIVCRFADYIDKVFGPEESKLKGYPGHQEIELALVKLYRVTGEEKYLKLSKFFIDERGKEPNYFTIEWEEKRERKSHWNKTVVPLPDLIYNQAHKPVRLQDVAVGHAVRAVYMYSGMADIAMYTGDIELFNTCKRIWNDIIKRQMYITGGVGSTHHGEAFSFDYDLPNDTVYAETCASIGLVFFAHRLQQMEAKSTYADVIERILYNLIPGSISLEGREFFYVNPLEVWPEACEKNPGKHHIKAERQKWFGCACCPPNVARLIASLGDYIYSISNNTLFTHFYISGDVEVSLPSGKFNLRQESDYPHNGNINFKIFTHEPVKFSLALRIPNWCKEFKLFINGEVLDLNDKINDGYAYLNRTWIYGDCITVEMEMPVEILQSNPKVRANAGKVCIQRGPVVYCVEEADNGENLSALTLCIDKGFKTENININSNKAMVVIAKGLRTKEDGWDDILYRPVGSNMEEPVIIKAVPYYLWGNRGIGEMQVWIRYKHTT